MLLLKVLAAYLIYDRFLKWVYLRLLYGKRGVTFMSVVPLPIIGDMLGFIKRVLAIPDRPHFTQWVRDSFQEDVPPCIGVFKPNGLQLIFTDADYLQDMYRTYNDCFTKHPFAANLFSNFMWNALIWTKSAEPSYKPRRHLVAHAFYASKLKAMSDTIFATIYNRLLKWPALYPSGELDLVHELIQIQGQIVVSASIGAEYVDQELPFEHSGTRRIEQMRVGNFINELTEQGILRDSQSFYLFFHELLKYLLTPHDRIYHRNWTTLIDFFKKVKAEKLEQIKVGKVGTDLLSTLLNEGEDVYGLIEDKALAELTLLDDVSIIYLAAVNTTQISVNNLMKYVHMDEYRLVREKLQAEVDSHLAFDAWDADGSTINE